MISGFHGPSTPAGSQTILIKNHFRNVFGSKYRPALSLNGNFVTINECIFIKRNDTVNATKYLQIDRLFLLRDFDPDLEQAEISIYITVSRSLIRVIYRGLLLGGAW